MATLNEANDPKEKSDVEEQKCIRQKKRVVKAPCPDVRVSVKYCRIVVFEEGEIKEY